MDEALGGDGHQSVVYQNTSIFYDVCATIIFVVMSYCMFFPYNRIIPLDRRTAAAICATLCYVTRAFLFPNKKMNLEAAVDFDVIILLAAIMVINYIVINQKETKSVIQYTQDQIYENPKYGFWLVSFAAFATSPFLTNDGICLLFVEPILNAFDRIEDSQGAIESGLSIGDMRLDKADALYFLLSLACSTNTGSALTYTGNPQNMIVASDAIGVMPPYLFFLYMLLPSIGAWLVTTLWIQRCWIRAREVPKSHGNNIFNKDPSGKHMAITHNPMNDSSHHSQSSVEMVVQLNNNTAFAGGSSHGGSQHGGDAMNASASGRRARELQKQEKRRAERATSLSRTQNGMERAPMEPLSPPKPPTLMKKVARILTSPFPYAMMMIMAIMIAMIFVDIMSIAGLVCVTAVIMTMLLVLGNHWQGLPVFGGNEGDRPLTAEEKIENTSQFFDELFDSIDYNLLIIFIGLFIVVENIASTGIPKQIWDGIVGAKPFATVSSVTGISIFILVCSQFLGNVPVIQLALPNVEPLGDAEKRYAWAIISYVATIGGNLTITGSAANIIVAEKAARIDPTAGIDFFKHYAVCFWVTLFSCIVGAMMITATVMIDNNIRESW